MKDFFFISFSCTFRSIKLQVSFHLLHSLHPSLLVLLGLQRPTEAPPPPNPCQKKGKCPQLTRVDFPIGAHSVGVHNVLEARGELVGPYQGGRRVGGWYTVHKRRDRRAAFPLQQQSPSQFNAATFNIKAQQRAFQYKHERGRQCDVHL